MDGCPTEIISQIISLACTDCGVTACSLRLVNRFISDVAEAYRFQSVAVVGNEALGKLLQSLQYASPRHNPLSNLYNTILTTRFPVLSDLTIRFPSAQLHVPLYSPLHPSPMPNLRNLHFAYGLAPILADEICRISHLIPYLSTSLVALRFTNVRLSEPCPASLCYLLGRECNLSPDDWTRNPDILDNIMALPPSVRTVSVQPSQPIKYIGWWRCFQEDLVERLKQMESYREGPRFSLRSPSASKSQRAWRNEWLEPHRADMSS
ncbi:hypothetical protein JAAARDRAFT_606708 [Jaapia argillacea MUCL 33604]|uniref:Uncharacterized protein n=1 Tax=Jaapia argillacea MUCL 33604 TaxID=933084 RepID=A0A067QCZ4_9AGAM|nr:hypothetical protein JAAARDRAFT_606708 [Jaapia argillacea MUCL 33604]